MNFLSLFMLVWILVQTQYTSAQKIDTDYYPNYTTWNSTYQIDKIVYTPKATILHLRFAKKNEPKNKHTFYPTGSKNAWFLTFFKRETFSLKAIKNIAINDSVVIGELGNQPEALSAHQPTKIAQTFFSCELHFAPMPRGLKKVSLIEGENHEYNREKLNCIDIDLIKRVKDPNIAQERIAVFEYNCLYPDTPKKFPKRVTPAKISGEELDLKQYQDALINEAPNYKVTPSYLEKRYIIDAIIKTEAEIIFLLVFYDRPSKHSGLNLYPPEHEDAWYLKDGKNRYPLKKVTQIRVDDKLVLESIGDEKFTVRSNIYSSTKLTCLAHFDKLPKNVKKVHLIEGDNQKTPERKRIRFFNFHKITIK